MKSWIAYSGHCVNGLFRHTSTCLGLIRSQATGAAIFLLLASSVAGLSDPALAQDAPLHAGSEVSRTTEAQSPLTGNPVVEAAPSPTSPPAPTPAPVLSGRLGVGYSLWGSDGKKTLEPMEDLRVVSTQHTKSNVGRQVALNVVMLALGGGMAFQGFVKEDLAGSVPEGVVNAWRLKNPASSLLIEKLERQADVWLGQRETIYIKPLVVNSGAWRLIYDALTGDSNTYKLVLDASIFKERENGSFFFPNRVGKPCRYESDSRTMDEWKANDYQAVVDLAPVAAEYCANSFVAQLPELLEIK